MKNVSIMLWGNHTMVKKKKKKDEFNVLNK